MFASLGRWCYRRRSVVIGLWLVVAVVLGGLLSVIGTQTRTEISLPDVESRRGMTILEDHFGEQGSMGTIVFTAPQGVEDPEVQAAMEELFEIADAIDQLGVVSPFSPEGATQIATAGPLALSGRAEFLLIRG